jgi:large subunit ribosomal protein L6
MSRIGRKPIKIPQGVDVTIGTTSVAVKGPKGNLSVALHPHVKAVLSPDRILTVEVLNAEDIGDRALWGLSRKLIANAIDGVQKAFEVKLEFIGVGFRVSVAGNKVQMEVGFSHPIEYLLPEGITASVDKNVLTIVGIDKQTVGETAARIRRIRPPEPYKGKGIKYSDETIRRKAGKAAKAGA